MFSAAAGDQEFCWLQNQCGALFASVFLIDRGIISRSLSSPLIGWELGA